MFSGYIADWYTYWHLDLPCLNMQIIFKNYKNLRKNKFWCLTAYVPPSLIEKNYVNILPSDLLLWPCVFYSRCCVWHDVSLAERPEPVRPVTWGTAFITGSDHFTCSRFMFAGCRKLLISCAKTLKSLIWCTRLHIRILPWRDLKIPVSLTGIMFAKNYVFFYASAFSHLEVCCSFLKELLLWTVFGMFSCIWMHYSPHSFSFSLSLTFCSAFSISPISH